MISDYPLTPDGRVSGCHNYTDQSVKIKRAGCDPAPCKDSLPSHDASADANIDKIYHIIKVIHYVNVIILMTHIYAQWGRAFRIGWSVIFGTFQRSPSVVLLT